VKNALIGGLDRIGAPFLFAEERTMVLGPGESNRFPNILPKFLFILEANVAHGFGNQRPVRWEAGQTLVHLGTTMQNYVPPQPRGGGHLRTLRVTLDPTLLQKALALRGSSDDFLAYLVLRLPPQALLPAPPGPHLSECLHAIRRELRLQRPESRVRVNALLKLAILEILQAPGGRPERPLIEKIESFLDSQMERSLTLGEIAAHSDRSEEHLTRIYRQERGHTIFQELRRRRIEKAKYYLLCSDLSVTSIAERVGFSTVALFSRTFRQETGASPRSFRYRAGMNPP
jgi:AraC family transcriptional regulator